MSLPLSTSFQGFLPPRSIVMTRRPKPSLHCLICEGRWEALSAERGLRPKLIFVSTDSPTSSEKNTPEALALLDRMIEAMGLRRDQVDLRDVSASHSPASSETGFCRPFFLERLDALQPGAIVAMGQLATQTLLETQAPLSDLRGRFLEYRGSKLMPTFHPAELLRRPELKREAWVDLQNVASELGIRIPRK